MLLHINYRSETWAYIKTGISTLKAAELAFVRIGEWKTKSERERDSIKQQILENLMLNAFKGKLICNRMRWYGRVLKNI
jgi:DNA-binding transcriptional regulator LsrR (DeoR family)